MPRKTAPKSKLTDQDRRLIEFGRRVLQLMEIQDPDGDLWEEVQAHADDLGFASVDEDGYFKANLS